MAKPTLQLIEALRDAAARLYNGATYAWGHHGYCNCGHVLQSITHKTPEALLQSAHTCIGEWTEIAEDYCGLTNLPAYQLMHRLEQAGLTPTDVHHIEYLNDRSILEKLPGGFRWLRRNERSDVIVYLNTLANVLEDQLAWQVTLPSQLFDLSPGMQQFQIEHSEFVLS